MLHEAWGGVTCDHLYQNCPSLVRVRTRQSVEWDYWVKKRLIYPVAPEGTDICGLCYRRWKAEEAEA